MLSLLAALAFATPPDFALRVSKATVLNTELAKALPEAGRRDIRGGIIADDGSAMFWGRDELYTADFREGISAKLELLRRSRLRHAGPITAKQKVWMEQMSHTEEPCDPVGQINVVSAKSRSSVLVQYSFHPDGEDRFRAALDKIDFLSPDPADNTTILKPGKEGFHTDFVANIENDSLLATYYKDEGKTYSFVDTRLVGTNEPIKGEIVPGVVPTIFDSSRNMILCFTFTEEGTPYALLIESIYAKTDRIKVTRPGGRVSVTALLPKGRIVTTCLPFREDGDDGEVPKWGLYQCDPPYAAFKYLGPYRLIGSSRNGQWLLISHLKTKKAWLVSPS